MELFNKYAGSGTESLAAKLDKIRGDISHDGDLLREELFDSGFTPWRARLADDLPRRRHSSHPHRFGELANSYKLTI